MDFRHFYCFIIICGVKTSGKCMNLMENLMENIFLKEFWCYVLGFLGYSGKSYAKKLFFDNLKFFRIFCVL